MDEVLTDRLRLRGWVRADVDPYAGIVADAETMAFMGSGPIGRAEAADQIARFEGVFRDHGTPQWAAEDRATGRLVGRVGLFHHPDWPLDPDNVEVGWLLDRARWGEGLATEGGQAALAWAWANLDVEQVISLARPENVRSTAVMRRLGLTERGRRSWRGFEHVWYAIERPGGP